MVSSDKAEGKAQELGGKLKEKVGAATDNDDLQRDGAGDQAEGKTQQVSGDVKEGVDKLKDDLTN